MASEGGGREVAGRWWSVATVQARFWSLFKSQKSLISFFTDDGQKIDK